MPSLLMISDITHRLGLDHRTAKYVLEKATSLRLPPATGQGQHRRFEHKESITLAICTQLVMTGMPIRNAEIVTMKCLERELKIRPNAAHYVFDKPKWSLRIVNGQWCQLKRHTTGKDFNFNPYYNFAADDGHEIEPEFEGLLWFPSVELNLTTLAWRLSTP